MKKWYPHHETKKIFSREKLTNKPKSTWCSTLFEELLAKQWDNLSKNRALGKFAVGKHVVMKSNLQSFTYVALRTFHDLQTVIPFLALFGLLCNVTQRNIIFKPEESFKKHAN